MSEQGKITEFSQNYPVTMKSPGLRALWLVWLLDAIEVPPMDFSPPPGLPSDTPEDQKWTNRYSPSLALSWSNLISSYIYCFPKDSLLFDLFLYMS